MDRILGFLFDVVWIWYVPTLIEGLIVAVILLSLESLLARSRRMWLEVRTIVLYLIFLKLSGGSKCRAAATSRASRPGGRRSGLRVSCSAWMI